jgi:hypothetical protein
MMNGVILAYSSDVSAGVIKGEDGRSYYFPKTEWASAENHPVSGLTVTFSRRERNACHVRITVGRPGVPAEG